MAQQVIKESDKNKVYDSPGLSINVFLSYLYIGLGLLF